MTGMHIDVETYHSYPLEVAGLKRDLPIGRVSDSLYIAAFVIFGDVELTKACASELIKKLPPYDVLITAEAKGIPLVYEMARQLGDERYLIARKAVKLYMKEPAQRRGTVERCVSSSLMTSSAPARACSLSRSWSMESGGTVAARTGHSS